MSDMPKESVRLGVRLRELKRHEVAAESIEIFIIETGQTIGNLVNVQLSYDVQEVVRATLTILVERLEIKPS